MLFNILKNRAYPLWLVSLIASVYIATILNLPFFTKILEIRAINTISNVFLTDVFFIIGLYIFLIAVIQIIFSVLSFPRLSKAIFCVLLIASASANYFINEYSVLIDNDMIQNLMETDFHESLELINIEMVLSIFIFGVLPSIFLSLLKIDYGSEKHFIIEKVINIAVSAVIIIITILMSYQSYASTFRENHYLRDLIIPINFMHGLNSYAKSILPSNISEYQFIGLDAQKGKYWKNNNSKKVVSIIIVGETARRSNFSLFGYNKKTNPELEKQDLIQFNDFTSCGTSTAASLPCLFSRLDRKSYTKSVANNSDNFLDIIQRANFRVVWLDNNSGCKEVCNRVEPKDITATKTDKMDPRLCSSSECFDMIMLKNLKETIDSTDQDTVIVMHQKGSHGPRYYLRTPTEFQKFTPFCQTSELQRCTQEEVTNAYNNTILYTDHFISKAIDFLKDHNDEYDTNLMYFSDHGESLGEKNLYLHGIPYAIAPKEQIEVPFFVWLSESYQQRFAVNTACLNNKKEEPLSHDNLFDSVIGLLNIETKDYQMQMDLFASCHDNSLIKE